MTLASDRLQSNDVPSLVRGGPFWRLLRRLGLLGLDGLPTGLAAAKIALFCWLPLAVLAGFDSRNWTLNLDQTFFADLNAYARFLITVFILIITDRSTDHRLHRLLTNFEDTGIVRTDMHADYFQKVRLADHRTSSGVAEAVILLFACLLSLVTLYYSVENKLESWMVAAPGRAGFLSPAGWWHLAVSMPLYYLLILRWLWRLLVWTLLMWDIAHLPLRLVPTHPDRVAGLGFLTTFPSMFVPLVFSLGVVFAAGVLEVILIESGKVDDLEIAVAVWTVLVLIVFVGPLAVFSPKLMLLKEQAILEYGALVAHCTRHAEQQMSEDFAKGQPLDKDTISMVADISAGLQTIDTMKPMPVALVSLLPLIVSALLPALAAAAVKFPVGSLLWSLFTSVI